MRRLLIFAVAVIMTSSLVGCNSKKQDRNVEDSRALMKQSIELACHYRDSIKLAKDSATIQRLMTDFEAALTKLNYQYPADIYINSSENQNEVLTNVTMRMLEIRDSILYRLAHPKVAADSLQNTIPADSVQ